MHKPTRATLIVLASLLLVLGSVTSCETTKPPACTPAADEPKEDITLPWIPDLCASRDLYEPAPPYQPWYVPSHLIAIGPEADLIHAVQWTENQLPVKLLPLLADPLSLGFVDSALEAECPALEDLLPTGPTDVLMQVYRICGTSPVSLYRFPLGSPVLGDPALDVPIDVAAYLSFNYDARQSPHAARADLLYVTGPGRPWDMRGSPWTAMGSPWTAMGSAPNLPDVAASAAFHDQWALGIDRGVGLVKEEERTTSLCGTDVRVGVFDTAPVDQSQLFELSWMTPPTALTITYMEPNAPRHAEELDDLEARERVVADHGLAVSGLIHGVAPSSRIHLYRVLDNEARGELAALNFALLDFISGVVDVKDSLPGAVINLSLGIHPPQDPGVRSRTSPGLSGLPLHETVLRRMEELVPEGVVTLKILLTAADCHGIVVVGAAGNEATSDEHPYPQIPASFETTLDVGAVNWDADLACFTSAGRLAAPGGEGNEDCEPDWSDCEETCAKGLLVPVRQIEPCNLGYAYWAGTSFSAPLISGAAALVIEEAAADLAAPGWAFPGPVSDTMYGILGVNPLDDDTLKGIEVEETYHTDLEAILH